MEFSLLLLKKMETYLTTKIMLDPLNAELNGLTKMASSQWKSSGRQTVVRSPAYDFVQLMGIVREFSW